MHQSIMTKIKKYASEDCIALDVIIKHSIKVFECLSIRIINSIKKWIEQVIYSKTKSLF